MNAVLIIDESGAKGYSKNQERYISETGVMAGYLVPEDSLVQLRELLKKAFKGFYNNGKLHITDLSPQQQKKARNIVYDIFLSNKSNWLFEAISVEGLYQSANNKERSVSKNKELLHSKLFAGIFVKALAFIEQMGCPNSIKINVISDPIDISTQKKFKTEIAPLISLLTTGKIKNSPVLYNPQTSKVEKFECIGRFTPAEGLDFKFKHIDLDITCEDSELTLMADILANSTNYYIRKNLSSSPSIEPNSLDAIKDHPLISLSYGASNMSEQDINSISDVIYRRE